MGGPSPCPLGEPDREAYVRGYRRVCGVDEVGRGPLAGPVVAAAVVFPPGGGVEGLGDSKTLSPARRAALVPAIREAALGVGIGTASPREIDRLNILRASLLAMERALEELAVQPDFLLVDGTHRVASPLPQCPLVRGDARSLAVAAASIVAKEHRDALMVEYGRAYPGYGFEEHKGYPTRAHREALRRLGPCPIHRRSFRGVEGPAPPAVQPGLFGG
ncbi:MAG: ribonuclease HII [Deferrisomatales bacterium]